MCELQQILKKWMNWSK